MVYLIILFIYPTVMEISISKSSSKKKRGLSLSSARNTSIQGKNLFKDSGVSFFQPDAIKFQTQRYPKPSINFTYTKINEHFDLKHKNSIPAVRFESPRVNHTNNIIQAQCGPSPVKDFVLLNPTRNTTTTTITETSSTQVQRKYKQQLQQNEKIIQALQDNQKVNLSRIQLLHTQLKIMENKYDEVVKENNQLKLQKERTNHQQTAQSNQAPKVLLQAQNKQNSKQSKKKINSQKMSQIQAKLNQMINDFKQ